MIMEEVLSLLIEGKDKISSSLKKATDGFSNLKGQMQEARTKGAERLSQAMDKLKTGIKIGVTGAIVGLIGTIGALGVNALNLSKDMDKAFFDIQAQLNTTEEEAKQLTQVGLDVWANNFGDSMGDVSDAIVKVSGNIKGLEGDLDGIQGATENAIRLRDAFGIEIAESTEAVSALMENFGITADEAFDFITTGFQQGLNKSDDFLDSISEYSVTFGSADATVSEFFSTLQTGLQDGVLGTDKAADLFKEFSIRIQEGTDAQKDAITSLGINADTFLQTLSDGTRTISGSFSEFIALLATVEDPLERNRIGVELFGTQFEDLTAKGVLAIDTLATDLADFSGQTESLDTQYQDFGSLLSGIWRKATVKLKPFTDKILEFANDNLPKVEAAIDAVVGALEILSDKGKEVADFLVENGETVKEVLIAIGIAILIQLVPAFIAWAAAAASAAIATIAAAAPVILITAAIGLLVFAIIQLAKNFDKIKATIGGFVDSAKEKVTNLKDSVVGGFNNIKEGITNVIDKVKETIKKGFNAAVDFAKKPINSILGFVNSAIGGINTLIEGANQVPGVNISKLGKIPLLAKGGRKITGNAVVGEAGPELVTFPRPADIMSNKETERNINNDNRNQSKTTKIDTIIVNNNQDFDIFLNKLKMNIL